MSQAFKDRQNNRAPQKVFCPYDHAGQSSDVIAKQARRAVVIKNAPVVGETGRQLNIMADAQFQRGERFARISDRPGKHGQRLGVNVLALDCFGHLRLRSRLRWLFLYVCSAKRIAIRLTPPAPSPVGLLEPLHEHREGAERPSETRNSVRA